MKFWGAMVLLCAAGCASIDRPASVPAPAGVSEGREYVDRLRVDTVWRPPPTGGECVSCWYEMPPNSYIAQGWPWYGYCHDSQPLYWRAACQPRPRCYD